MLTSGDYAQGTIKRYLSALRRALTLAVQEHKLDRHPMKGLRFLPEGQRDRFFTDEELRRLHGVLPAAEWLAVAFALGTGLRLSEQLGLKWQHIDWDSKTATIPLSKSGKTHRVPLSDEVLTILQEQFSESPYVFPDADDPLRPAEVREVSKRIADRLAQTGIPQASWHVLRHSFASRQVQAGTDIVAVSRLLGHSTILTTIRYAHHAKTALHDAVNRVSVTQFAATTKPVDQVEAVNVEDTTY